MTKWQTLLIKELRHLFRDTKTIIQTVVVPTFLTPLLIGGIVWYISSIAIEESKKDYEVAVYDLDNTQLLNKFEESERLNITKYEAIEDVIGSQSYLPTLTDIVKACSEINGKDGFPSIEEAYIEARKSYSPRNEYPWSHPIVYFSGKKLGWSTLDEKDSKELFFAFKRIFLRMKERAIEGYEFKIPKQDKPIESLTLNSKLFNELRKKHNV
mgnify:CR=1 FL=1